MVDSVPKGFLGRLPLQRAIAEKYNDPAKLETEDFGDFEQELPDFLLRSNLVNNLELYSLNLSRVFKEGLTPPQNSTHYLDLFRTSHKAMELVKQLTGWGGVSEIADEDVDALATVFGEEARPIVREMQEEHAKLQQDIPYVFVGGFYPARFSKFDGDPKFAGLVEEANRLYPEFYSEFGERLGAPSALPVLPFGAVEVFDARGSEFSPVEFDWRVPVGGIFDNESGTIGLSSEALMLSGQLTTFHHELNHLWLHQTVGQGKNNTPFYDYGMARYFYSQIPQWFREGLAVVMAGQVEEKITVALPYKSPEVLARLDRLDWESSTVDRPRDYYPAALAVGFIMEQYGDSMVGRIVGQMDMHHSFEQALAILIPAWESKENFYQTLSSAIYKRMNEEHSAGERDAYLDAISAVDPEARESYGKEDGELGVYSNIAKTLTPIDAVEDLSSFAKTFEHFLEQYPDGVFAPAIHYLLGKIYHKLADPVNSSKHFREILKDPDRFWVKVQEALYLEAEGRVLWGGEGIEEIQKIFPYLTDPNVRQMATNRIRWVDQQRTLPPELPNKMIETDTTQGCACSVPSSAMRRDVSFLSSFLFGSIFRR